MAERGRAELDAARYAMAVGQALELLHRLQARPGWPGFHASLPTTLKTDLSAFRDAVRAWFDDETDGPLRYIPWSNSRSPSARAESDKSDNSDQKPEPLSEHRE